MTKSFLRSLAAGLLLPLVVFALAALFCVPFQAGTDHPFPKLMRFCDETLKASTPHLAPTLPKQTAAPNAAPAPNWYNQTSVFAGTMAATAVLLLAVLPVLLGALMLFWKLLLKFLLDTVQTVLDWFTRWFLPDPAGVTPGRYAFRTALNHAVLLIVGLAVAYGLIAGAAALQVWLSL